MRLLTRALSLALAVSVAAQQGSWAAIRVVAPPRGTAAGYSLLKVSLPLTPVPGPAAGLSLAASLASPLSPIPAFPEAPATAPTPRAPAAPATAQPAAACVALERLAAPQAPNTSAAEAKAESDYRWDGSQPASDLVETPISGTARTPLDAASSLQAPARRIPGPKVIATRAGAMAAWLGLIGFSASQGHVLPVIVGAAVSLALSALVKAMFYSDEAGRPYDFSLTPEEQRGMALAARLTSALTAKLGLPGPKQFKVDPTISGLNAGAAGSPQDYALILSPSVLGLPADQMEGVLAHELGHVWHRDSAFVKLNVFLAPLAPILALACGHGAGFAAMTAAAFVTWGAAIRITEYHADEFAARVQGSGRPLGDFFRRYGADIREHAKSLEKQDDSFYAKQGALAYRAYKIKRIFSKLGALPLLLLAAAVKSHPSPERRAARIERLEK